MKRTNFYLSEKELEFLKRQSKQQGLPASEILRRWIDREIEKEKKNGKRS